MNILITGGSGFIGSAITRKLLTRPDITVTVVDNLSEKIHGNNAVPFDYQDDRIHFHRGDVTDRSTMETVLTHCDAVIHLAAETGTGQSMYDIEHYSRVNVMGTALLLDVLVHSKHTVRKVLIGSSRAIYGEGSYSCGTHGTVYPKTRHTEDMCKGDYEVKCPVCGGIVTSIPTREDATIHPASLYGITKQIQEAMVMTLCPSMGIVPVSLRFQNVYGPGQSLANPYTGILSIFSNRLRTNSQIQIFEDGRESRDFVYIDDAVDATVKALFSDNANGQIFNVGSGTAVDVLSIARQLKEIYASHSDIVVSGKYREGDIRHITADISHIKDTLGFKPQTSIDTGLMEFTRWVLKQPIFPDRYEASLDEMKNKGLFK